MREKEFITVQELTALIPLSAKTLYEEFKQKDYPGVQRIGHKYVIHRETFIDWFREHGGDTGDPS